ncbi:MAG: glycosyltransferase family 4 protein [Candidatus Methylomirabilaceae bacterium]
MKIGFFTCNAPPLVNGLTISIETFARHLRRLGHRVFLFGPRYPGHVETEPDTYRFASLRAPTHHRYALPLPRLSGAIDRAIPRLGLQIIHAHHPFLVGPYARRLARRMEIPFVFSYHTLYEHYAHYVPFLSSLAARFGEARSYRFANEADLVTVPTAGVRARLVAHGVGTPLEVIPTGVDPPAPSDEPKPGLRRRLGLSEDDVILLYVGRLAKEKNLELLLRATRAAVHDAPHVSLALVGEGDEEGWLRQQADRLGLSARVRFVGAVPHQAVGDWYRAADLFVFPSVSETQGLVVLEAMAHGLPVLAIRSIGTSDFVEDGASGALANPSEGEFTRRLLELLRDAASRARYAELGRIRAMQFSAEASTRRLLAAYDRLLMRGPARAAAVSSCAADRPQ